MASLGSRIDEVDAERAWLGTFAAAVGALVVGSLVFTNLVWDRFLWRYFWGPVYADAKGAACAVMRADGPELISSGVQCAQLQASDAVYAQPGYTIVSEIGYMVVLVFMLIGVYLLAQRLEIGGDLGIYFPLIPFMLFGGALRVVEDAFDRAALCAANALENPTLCGIESGVESAPEISQPAIGYPLNTLLISPVIYFTVFFVTLAALSVAIYLENEGYVSDYRTTLGTIGTAVLGITLLYLTYLSLTKSYVRAYPQMLAIVLVLASGIAYAVWRGIEIRWPETLAGTGAIGFFVVWAHAIDGVANVVSADWLSEIGVVYASGQPLQYTPKHPANDIIISITESIQPAALTDVIGSSWPFLAIKLVVAAAILGLFTDDFVEESTNYALLLLIAVTAVGLGPGTRDVLRVTFGI